MKRFVSCVLAFVAPLCFGVDAANATSAACLSSLKMASVRLDGTLTVERHQHPNGQEMRPFILVLPKPVCLTYDAPDDTAETARDVSRVQIAGDFDVAWARRAIDQPVSVTGSLFGAETAWHVTSVLILVTKLERSASGPASPIAVVRAFYEALARADGEAVQPYLVESKRGRGGYTVDGISKYYSEMSPRLEVTEIVARSDDDVEVAYRYGTRKGLLCSNRVQVSTTLQGGQRLIEAVRSDRDLCR